MRILVLGVTGMLGRAVFRVFAEAANVETWGTCRGPASRAGVPDESRGRVVGEVDVLDADGLTAVFARVRPDAVINCVGLIKQLSVVNDPLVALPINSMLPHRLARLCAVAGARLVHISTDCVFSGRTGGYRESDPSDAQDLYGRSKFIGEVTTVPHAITLRTSLIGHEQSSAYSLVDWFLSQPGPVKGYSRAVFSGFPTVEMARIILEYVLPRPELCGLYHVAAAPISKLDLLGLIAARYGKTVTVVPDDTVAIDRSLNGDRFFQATGYVAPDWPSLVALMHRYR